VGDNGPIDATLKVLSDGLGTNLPMEASTTGVNFTGNLTQSGTALQPVLVSGTNIKTINSTSILGSGNIAVVTSPSGVAGAIQFSNGSAFASDATNFFWDDTNNRLGVGTNAPTSELTILKGGGTPYSIDNALLQLKSNTTNTEVLLLLGDNSNAVSLVYGGATFSQNQYIGFKGGSGNTILRQYNNDSIGIGATTTPSARVQVVGSGSTSATTSLLVQNSAGTQALRMRDDRVLEFSSVNNIIHPTNLRGGINDGMNILFNNGFTICDDTNVARFNMPYFAGIRIPDTSNYPLTLGSDTKAVASAQLEMVSTTQGFLPPRMTTTQRNAIASPATGLVLYDSTTNKLQCYDGSTWNDLF
jgi:hypothetical protein